MQQKRNWQADINGIKYVLNAVIDIIIPDVPTGFLKKISKSQIRKIRFFFAKKICQIEGRSAVLRRNVNKLSRIFSSIQNLLGHPVVFLIT